MTMEGLALLGDLETHTMSCSTCPIRFLQPWAREGLTPKQWQDLEALLHRYLANFMRLANIVMKETPERYPFVVQASIGCELQPNGTARGFCEAALDGRPAMGLEVATGTWVARQRDPVVLRARDILNGEKSILAAVQFLLRGTCVGEIKSFMQAGAMVLGRQERPVAVVFARAPPPADPLVLFLLVCRVSGFYPRPIRVAWLQDGEEVGPGRRLDSSGILPNADQTYQLRSSLAVGPGAGHRYACRVEHSSLGPRGLLIPWEHSRRWGPGLAVGIALGALAVAALAAVLVRCRRRATGTSDRGSPGPEGRHQPGERIVSPGHGAQGWV
ncbi:antigen-presenting glycoprotein CD1d-like isoform X2 [Carettochelys insculpta]